MLRGSMNLLAFYTNNLDPVIVHLCGPLALRWYGLAYVAGFIVCYLLMQWMSRNKLYCVEEKTLGDFATAICIFGVICGGRLGEFFFYWLPEQGFSGIVADLQYVWDSWTHGQFALPWVFRVYEGGMASHGGIIGVGLVAVYFSLKHKWSIPAVTDGITILAPVGLFFGRLANFINGELWGRVTDSPIGVRFVSEAYALPAATLQELCTSAEHIVQAPLTDFLSDTVRSPYEALLQLCYQNDAVADMVVAQLPTRYPSQLFEAFGEGLLIFLVLFPLRLLWKKAPDGIFTALFAFMYAAARITCECFKEPDAGVWYGITEGQWLTMGVIAAGFLFLGIALRNARRAA